MRWRTCAEIEAASSAPSKSSSTAPAAISVLRAKPVPNNILGITYEDLITLTNNNLIGTMLVTQAFVPQMVERQHGIVVNIASVAAHAASRARRHLCHPQGGRHALHPLPRR
jgi:2-hydroxycyclohexanecarboxyl-CoA dehydrogenase